MIHIDDRNADLGHARAHDAFTILLAANFEWRPIDHDSAFRPGHPTRPHRTGTPYVLADIQANAYAVEFEDRGFTPRCEIPLLIEHRIVWQKLLAVMRDNLAIQQHGAGIVDVLVVVFRKAEKYGDARHFV